MGVHVEVGVNYALQFLNIPTKPDGSSQYEGPYTKKGHDLFDKAVAGRGDTITFRDPEPEQRRTTT